MTARLLIATAAACLALAAPADATDGISYRTLFQNPGVVPGEDLSLENHAIGLINATPAGAKITFALRDFNRDPVADALIAADVRGVVVDGVVDGDERNRDPVRRLKDALGDHFVICRDATLGLNSCIASGPPPSLQHNKFFTFSRLEDGRHDVVLQTSKNFFGPSQLSYYNDMVEIDGDVGLHAAYVKYLHDMQAQVRSNSYYFPAFGDGGRNTIFPSPRPQPDLDTDDTIVDRMSEIDCSDGGTIRAANFAFRSARAVIMRKLVALEREGCDVEVIVTNTDGDILSGLVAAGIPVHPFFLRALTGVRPQVVVHSKFWLVDAKSTPAGERTKLVYAGSSNWRADQQYSDDLLLRIRDDGVHAAYSEYWELIKSRAASDQTRPATDAIAPFSAHAVAPEPNAAGWHNTDVTLRVAGSDGHSPLASGLGRLNVTLSGAQSATMQFAGETAGYNVQELPVTAEGETAVEYYSVDAKANAETPRSAVVRVDKTAPAIAGLPERCRLWPPNKKLVRVADVTATDAVSGIQSLTVTASSNARSDAGDVVIDGGSVRLRAEKRERGRRRTYAIVATATDVAGNAGTATAECVVRRRSPQRDRRR